MNPVAAANTISQERSSATVTFPVTGDSELDAVSGILWVLEDSKIRSAAKVRVLQYLAERFKVQAALDERVNDPFSKFQISPGLAAPYLPQPSTAPWITSTSGGFEVAEWIKQLQNQQAYQPPQISPPASAP